MIFGHLRRSTALLGAVFIITLVLYVLVRPPAAPRYTVVTTPSVGPLRTPTTTTTTTASVPTSTRAPSTTVGGATSAPTPAPPSPGSTSPASTSAGAPPP